MFLLIMDSLEAALLGKISIHLMFLLIAAHEGRGYRSRYFNTSHVSINRCCRINRRHRKKISIHLMFLLIKQVQESGQSNVDFNTSHVSINQGSSKRIPKCSQISIHLMFLLIQRFYQLFRFYYISNSLKIPAFSNFSQV